MSKHRFKGVAITPNQNAVLRTDIGSLVATNAVCDACSTSVWGYKGCSGKGGKTTNAVIIEKKTAKENV